MSELKETRLTAGAAERSFAGPALHFVGGELVPGLAGRTFETLDPATNEPITEVAEGLAEDVDRAVAAARNAFEDGPWPRLKAAERASCLRRVADAIEAAGEEIVRNYVVRNLRTPFGGMKESGIGREGGHYSFDFYCELETIHTALGDHHIPRLGLPTDDKEVSGNAGTHG